MIDKISNKLRALSAHRKANRNFIHPDANVSPNANIAYSELHGNVVVRDRSVLHKCLLSGKVSIGSNTTLWGPNITVLSKINAISIGNFCSIASGTTIQEYFHNHQAITTYYIGRNLFQETFPNEFKSKGPIHIGSDVWIGTGAQIMSGVTVGHGAVIGANSTVTKDVPPYAIVGGVPAKIIGYRFSDEIIEKLLNICWWDWEVEKIKQHQALFESELTLSMLDNLNA